MMVSILIRIAQENNARRERVKMEVAAGEESQPNCLAHR